MQVLSLKMMHTRPNTLSKILENVYADPIIEKIDIEDIKSMLDGFTIEKCKVFLMGNSILQPECKILPKAIREDTDKWFGTKYRTYKAPDAKEIGKLLDS